MILSMCWSRFDAPSGGTKRGTENPRDFMPGESITRLDQHCEFILSKRFEERAAVNPVAVMLGLNTHDASRQFS